MALETKYPILLVHGMMIRNNKINREFKRVRDFLVGHGVKVYILNHDAVGTIENNAKQMKEEVIDILAKENVDKVNIIAHSKGGLDSRYMISRLDMGESVASLTTLSTPHYGSKMARKLLKLPRWIQYVISFFMNLWYKIYGDKNPDFLKLANEITDIYMIDFNKKTPNIENVYYQSYSSDISDQKVFLLYIPHRFSVYCEEDQTDGIVSVSSSKWGEYKGNMPYKFSHLEMVETIGGKKVIEKVTSFYYDIVKDLMERGY